MERPAFTKVTAGEEGGEKMNIQNVSKKGLTSAVIAASMLVGVIAGSTVLHAQPSNAQTVTPAVTSTTTPAATNTDPSTSVNNGTQSAGTFKSNENPAHEATESPQREAQENAGQMPTVR